MNDLKKSHLPTAYGIAYSVLTSSETLQRKYGTTKMKGPEWLLIKPPPIPPPSLSLSLLYVTRCLVLGRWKND